MLKPLVWKPHFENHLVWGSWALKLDSLGSESFPTCFVYGLGQVTEAKLFHKGEYHYWTRLLQRLH